MDEKAIRGDEVRRGQLVYLDALSNEIITSVGEQALSMRLLELTHDGQSALQQKTGRQILQRYKSAGGLVFALRQLTDDACIGAVAFTEISWQARHAKLSIAVIEKDSYTARVWSDLIQVVCQYTYWEANLNRLYVECHEDNQVLIDALEQSGLEYEGRLRQNIYRHGQYSDTLVYSILQREWAE